ncbi:alpha-protein kinase vwkA-like [Saccoglossus kowalevskii]
MSAFAHWTYTKYNGKLMLVDLQGVGLKLTDIAVATWDLLDKATNDLLFGMDNIARKAIVDFTQNHKCSVYCVYLSLPVIEVLSDTMSEYLGSEVQINQNEHETAEEVAL